MKKLTVAVFAILSAVTSLAQTPTTTNTAAKPSPAEQTMAVAQKQIDKNPKNFEAYNALALAQSRRARETSDVRFYNDAENTLQKSFAISPGNFDGQRIHVWLLLGKHEFAAALVEASKLNQRMPDDVMVYGFLTDANVELGNYKEAEAACQRMLDLRTGNLPAITRAAYLRELFGDTDGSLELMNMALQSTPPAQAEDGAWILTQMAHLKLGAGNLDRIGKAAAPGARHVSWLSLRAGHSRQGAHPAEALRRGRRPATAALSPLLLTLRISTIWRTLWNWPAAPLTRRKLLPSSSRSRCGKLISATTPTTS